MFSRSSRSSDRSQIPSDPRDATSFLRIIPLHGTSSGDTHQVQWTSSPSRLYRLEFAYLDGQAAPGTIAPPIVDALTHREHEVLKLLAKRLYDKEIAEELEISVETVKTHVKRLRGKLGASSRGQAATKARELGLIQDRDNRV